MSDTPRCANCGGTLAGFALGGFCSACLLERGLDTPTDRALAAPPNPHTTFGDYELLEEIAHGGMGVVFKARQRSLGRIVALKTILAGRLARPEEVARFRLEAEAAARLKHPNIVAIHEVGEWDGQHFFSMDYIEGRSLSALLRDGPLPAPQTARYVEKIARAVHYAHEQGVLHRDLKPSNVLLDARDEPHVTDFGLAKRLTHSELGTRNSELTLSGQVLGTPSFMPPEQASGQRDQMGPRSDVYSLGAILYHLLTGRPPFVGADVHAVLAQVLNSEVITPRLLNPTAPRDLETIALKCLEKEPSRRYESALALAEDLARHVNHEPIQAVPPSAIYRARKFVRRHRVGVAVAACFAIVLLAATVVSATFGFQANRDKTRALKAEAQAENEAREALSNAKRADALAMESQTVLNFFSDKVLAATRPEGEDGGLGAEVTVRRAVETAEPQVALIFTNNSKVETRIRHTLGSTYLYLGEYSNAIRQFERAMALHGHDLGSQHPNTYVDMDSLGQAYMGAGRLADAIPLFERLLQQREAVLGPVDRKTIHAKRKLAAAYMADSTTNRRAEVFRLYTAALETSRAVLGVDDPTTIDCMNGLAVAYLKAQEPTNALPLLESVVEFETAWHGPEAMGTLTVLGNLAMAYGAVGRADAAVPLYLQILKIQQAKLPPGHPDNLRTINNLGGAHLDAGRFDDAIRIFREALPIFIEKRGRDHPRTLDIMSNLGRAYAAAGEWTNAVPVRERLLKLLCQHPQRGSNHSATLALMDTLTMTYSKAGQKSEADALQCEVFHLRTGTANPTNPAALVPIVSAARVHLANKEFAEAEMLLQKCLEVYESQQKGLSPSLTLQSLLGASLVGQKQFTKAEPLLLQSYKGLKKREYERPSPTHAAPIKEAAQHLVQLYEAWGKLEEAEQWRQKLR